MRNLQTLEETRREEALESVEGMGSQRAKLDSDNLVATVEV
jgi:hypothetical protein